LSVAIPLSKRHCQKLTVFSSGANRSATLFGIVRGFDGGSANCVAVVAVVNGSVAARIGAGEV
jgi:hypothetical protein